MAGLCDCDGRPHKIASIRRILQPISGPKSAFAASYLSSQVALELITPAYTTAYAGQWAGRKRRRSAAFSASSRLFGLTGKTKRVRKKQSRTIIAADVRRFSYLINTNEVCGTHRGFGGAVPTPLVCTMARTLAAGYRQGVMRHDLDQCRQTPAYAS